MLGPWLDSILTGAIELVKTATSRSEPSVLEWHRGSCQLAQNRDLPDPSPRPSRRICGFNPNQAADSTLLVGRVTGSTDLSPGKAFGGRSNRSRRTIYQQ